MPAILQHYDPPLYFVTFCTWNRSAWLGSTELHRAFIAYAEKNANRGPTVGRYVLMPDPSLPLERFRQANETAVFKAVKAKGHALPDWQPGFFDHLTRHRESYAAKWRYVRQNPVRARLVKSAED